MSWIDYVIFAAYMAGVLGIGLYFFRRNSSEEDYYVGSRNINPYHVGLSIVATDVGGGFSIGLGGAGFLMGLSGSWLLFTGLLGAWLSAVLLIPRIKKLDRAHGFLTYPDFLRFRYGNRVAVMAAAISGLGYMGFTGAQMLAGAKLASATILQTNPVGMDPLLFSLMVIALVTIVYTVTGGLKAVIYTDTVQWIILMVGLVLVTIPVTLWKLGGLESLKAALPPAHFSLASISPSTFINWMVTIVPIWAIGMTLYQRMYACRDEQEAKKAWFTAGLFEYPVMAFSGVFLGMCARVVFPEAEPEMALPMLIRDMLPAGITGIIIAAYFSAIMSTADSCMMASSGNFSGDILRPFLERISGRKVRAVRLSMIVTFAVGTIAVILAARFTTVLNAILYTYSFMVSGLFVPTIGAYFWRKGSSTGALAAMIGGGTLTLLLMTGIIGLPGALSALELDATIYGIGFSLLLYTIFSLLVPDRPEHENLSISHE
ncbi:sodium:solute symporter [Prosthecochloris sp. HL-130-GSB]|jgi:solute:Na+ symporter, SSS family|uniref:sodium:solute symporter family protein n=1 Tax=Prosthecochloris sp. HL-130-GSB TaxID=1974213 RepID=UPI000A1C1794|nr:sodium:solute symporter family protein [Prosthecochloris sp. HL-130-GSB]ARM31129.1 sodium:solute symporter [Prosthecochloris sp. HL-130-GSB]